MTHFYLTLPSNSSEKYYPDNTLANFKTKLHNDVALWDDAGEKISFDSGKLIVTVHFRKPKEAYFLG